MDGQEYLNQISASNRPSKKSGNGVLNSTIFKVAIIGVVALIIIIIIGSVLGGAKSKEKDSSISLKLHLDNTAGIIKDYQHNVKSSSLRSSSASLYSILTNSSREITEYMTEKQEFKEKNIDKKTSENAKRASESLSSELFEAKINGNLDRVYAHKMAYEIAMLLNEESSLIKITNNKAFEEILEKSYDSLNNLYDAFNDFSETK